MFNFRYAQTKRIKSELMGIKITKMFLKGVIESVIKGEIKGDRGRGVIEERVSFHIRGSRILYFIPSIYIVINIYIIIRKLILIGCISKEVKDKGSTIFVLMMDLSLYLLYIVNHTD